MKNISFSGLVLLLLLMHSYCHAQDIIYLSNGDSLRGRIDKLNEQFLYFYPESKSQSELRVYSLKEIDTYAYNRYSTSKNKKKKTATIDRFQLEANGGLGYYLGDGANFLMAPESWEDPILQDYKKELRLNSSYSASICVFITENIGINAKYSYASFANSIYVLFLDTANKTIPGYITDDIKVDYFAPGFTLQWPFRDEIGYIQVDINLGYISYKNAAVILEKYTISGSTFGLNMRGVAALAVAPDVYLNLSVGFLSAQLPKIDIEFMDHKETFELNTMEYLDASRLDLHFGLSIKF